MKCIKLILFFACFLAISSAYTQDVRYKTGISFKKLFIDYQSQNGGSFSNFQEYNHGFEIGYHHRLQKNLNLLVPFKMGVVTASPDSIDCLRKTIMGLDAQFQYQFNKPNSKVVPYFMAGLGGVLEFEGEFNVQAPLGFGLYFKVADNAYINWQSEYRLSFSENRTNLHHGIGFVYLWNKDEEMELDTIVEMMEIDSDGDGVTDKLDLCPEVIGLAQFNGCPDMDSDGIPDYKDRCPDTFGLASAQGCPDMDGDGIADPDDECPKVFGVAELNGCPIQDRDGDGVSDDMDACPDERGAVDNKGCPSEDRDGDGVSDKNDKCPNVRGLKEYMGCPDTDLDGVPDPDDKCPVDAGPKAFNGCPDSDGDGLDDSIDKCPRSPGPVGTNGCPEIKKEDRETLDVAMRAVQFDTGRATLKAESHTILKQIAGILSRYPDYNLSISGHTDNTGNAASNQSLSERRAKACYDYLAQQGVSTSRMNYAGYGESRPIADNNTLNGRLLNRRVEFVLIPR